MKKFFLVLGIVAFASSTVLAQDTPKKPSFAGFVSNGFWDNWEVSFGLGTGTAFSNGGNIGPHSERFGFEGNFSLTKWLHPVVGVRGQLQGGYFNNFHPTLGKMTWPYMFVHADLMINASNWIGGYREDRAYYAVPFAGFGYLASNFTNSSQVDNHSGTRQEFAMTAGLLNKFRISRAFDFNLELKGLLTRSACCPAELDGSYLMAFTATAGFTYRFNQRNWQRGVPGYTPEDIEAFQEAVAAGLAATAALESENADLADQLAEAEAARVAAEKAAQTARAEAAAAKNSAAQEAEAADTSVILFDYSMSTLTPQEQTRLKMVADKIKNGPADAKYRIYGYADQQTGTKAGNRRVAENRAKRVYDFLVSQGVKASQLTYEGKGNSPDPFEVQAANRAAVIE